MEKKTEGGVSNENMEVGGHQKIRRPKLSDVIRKETKEKEVKIEARAEEVHHIPAPQCFSVKFSSANFSP